MHAYRPFASAWILIAGLIVSQPTLAQAQSGFASSEYCPYHTIQSDVVTDFTPHDVAVENVIAQVDDSRLIVSRRITGGWETGVVEAFSMSQPSSYGPTVAVNGARVALGLPGGDALADQPLRGVVHTFVFDTDAQAWVLEFVCHSDAEGNVADNFGASLAMEGNWLIVGAPGMSGVAGKAFVYGRPNGGTWSPAGALLPPAEAPDFSFGEQVAVDAKRALVTATAQQVPIDDSTERVIHAFDYLDGAWRFRETITRPMESDTGFGQRIAMRNSELAVLSGSGDSPDDRILQFYKDELDHWSPRTRVEPTDLGLTWTFGHTLVADGATFAVSLEGDPEHHRAAVLLMGEDEVRLFYLLRNRITPQQAAQPGPFVGFMNWQAIMVTPGADQVAEHFYPHPSDCNGNGIDDSCDRHDGLDMPDLDGDGLPDACGVEIDCPTAHLGEPHLGSASLFDERFDLDGDTLVIGPYGLPEFAEPTLGLDIYQFNQQSMIWGLAQAVTLPGERSLNDKLVLRGDILAIGLPEADFVGVNSGRVEVFHREGGQWLYDDTIAPWVPLPDMQFGRALALQGNELIIGAPGSLANGDNGGATYVFRRDPVGWVWATELIPPELSDGYRFGESVAISGSTVLASAPQSEYLGSSPRVGPGKVFVFTLDGNDFTQGPVLESPEPDGYLFGRRVGLSGSTAVIGDNNDFHVFTETDGQWLPTQHISNDIFGWSFSSEYPSNVTEYAATLSWRLNLRGDRLVIGDPSSRLNGKAYLLELVDGRFVPLTRLTETGAFSPTRFGHTSHVVVDGDRVLVSAGEEDGLLVYDLTPPDCDGDGIGDFCEIYNGQISDHNHNLVPDNCEDVSGACCTNDGCDVRPAWECAPDFVCDVSEWLPPSFTGCWGDANGDGVVTPMDRAFISANLHTTENHLLCLFDMDGDGDVTLVDRGLLGTQIGNCGQLPSYQNGSGMNGGEPDTRFNYATFMGVDSVCEEVSCP